MTETYKPRVGDKVRYEYEHSDGTVVTTVGVVYFVYPGGRSVRVISFSTTPTPQSALPCLSARYLYLSEGIPISTHTRTAS